jgi:hypothetical protein
MIKSNKRKVAEWTLKYDKDFRRVLDFWGIDDQGNPVLEDFNRTLMKYAEYCHGGSKWLWEYAMDELWEDWEEDIEKCWSYAVMAAEDQDWDYYP